MKDIANYVPGPPPKWVERFARLGLTAKGIVYCLIGMLAFMAAFELRGSTEKSADKKGVFQFLLEQPMGKVMLAIIGIGLLFYAAWRLIQALRDSENKGKNAKGIGKRIAYLFSGLIYGGLAIIALKMVLGKPTGNADSRQTLAGEILSQPFGQWLLGAVALGMAVIGIYQFYYGLSDNYKKKVHGSGIKNEYESLMIWAGKFGYMARGVVWLLIGYLFFNAALHANPKSAGGTGSAFQFLEEVSYGSYLLGAVALGLLCYGVFMFMRARYQPISS
ncbi:DUF1206 domain-containing protein [Adhaeribacter sp. BT258]|uniref:DUF1206 domain-containing protein n=1 Tax=Adhaeribacter terrigena TaxID=2793070 RepID=A0ABS1C663_9BACT|nr:DUF1206 domain-containing protein [Adhaeribacter terrigena]MBK0404862.1 DUF1206 domain-containing protein [Adhaeribacter terrigena]